MKRSMRFTAVVMATVMTVGTASTAMAAEWKHDSKGWWWQNDDGSYPAASWQWLDGNHDGVAECYYFDQTGYMFSNAKTPDGYQVNADGAWVINGAVQTKAVAASEQTKAVAASGQTKAQAADDYSGTYVDTWSDGTVATHVIAYNPADKTLTDTMTVNGSTRVDKFTYYGAAWNGYTLFELVSDDEKDALYFSAPGVMETGDSTIHRQ